MAVPLWLARVGPWALLLSPGVVLVLLGFQRRWTAEDSFIGFRAVANLLAGHGPVYNLGERVEVYSSPLWIGLLALVDAPFKLVLGERHPLERLAAALGLALSGFGLGAATVAARRLWRLAGEQGIFFPIGALLVVAVPAAWDFVTSGLETGLIYAWLGGSYLALVLELERQRGASGRPPCRWRALLFGLGPLVRPDLAILAALFLAVQLRLARPFRWRHLVAVAVAAATLPALYQLFRMGYFAEVVSTTAVAKEASQAYWNRGSDYFRDFVDPYVLWVPLALLAQELLWTLVGLLRTRDVDLGAVILAPVVGGALQALFVVRVGGDFMHGRMLLPCLMAVSMPFAAVAAARAFRLSLVVPWALVCALGLRVPYAGIGPQGIADERAFYVASSGKPNPVTLSDYTNDPLARDGQQLRAEGERPRPAGTLGLSLDRWMETPANGAIPASVVALRYSVGMVSYAAGPRVWIEEGSGGITNALNAHFIVERRGRPGHEKWLVPEWFLARFSGSPPASANEANAKTALGCGDLAELLRATEEPLTWNRFWRNVVLAPRLTAFRFAPDPTVALAELCTGRGRY